MITPDQENFIKQFVNENIFDFHSILSYLRLHDVVGEEIFKIAKKDDVIYNRVVEHGFGYLPIDTTKFVRRVPFYFYVANYDKRHFGDLSDIIRAIYVSRNYDIDDYDVLERIYIILEKMYYYHKMSIIDIMDYAHNINSSEYKGDFFFRWAHYLDLCEALHLENKYPLNFIYETNRVIQLAGEEPDIFEPGLIGFNEPFIRKDNEIIIGGEFPFTIDNKPALQWIGIWIEDAAYVEMCDAYDMDGKAFFEKELHIGLSPTTKIYLPYYPNDNELVWDPIYFGPLVMDFDNDVLKLFRTKRKFTQQQVADAVGVQLRTYQKWEKGEVKPDGYNLIRLMNFLNIESVQDFLKNTPIEDSNYEKFRARKHYN